MDACLESHVCAQKVRYGSLVHLINFTDNVNK